MSSSNGHGPDRPPASRARAEANETIAALRVKPRNVLLFRGFGTLVAGVVLFVLMLWLAPSVAPEHVVQRPVNQTSTTTTLAPAPTASTTAPGAG